MVFDWSFQFFLRHFLYLIPRSQSVRDCRNVTMGDLGTGLNIAYSPTPGQYKNVLILQLPIGIYYLYLTRSQRHFHKALEFGSKMPGSRTPSPEKSGLYGCYPSLPPKREAIVLPNYHYGGCFFFFFFFSPLSDKGIQNCFILNIFIVHK